MNVNKRLLYISEISLPNESAQAIQTLKMCSAFAEIVLTDIILFNSKKSFQSLKKDYLIRNKFNIYSAFKDIKSLNLINRFIFFLKIYKKLNQSNYNYIFTRSVFVSTLLSLCGYFNILELHVPNSGFTKYLFLIYKKLFNNKNQKFILIKGYINHIFKFPKNKFLVLETGVDLNDFKIKSKLKKKSCVYTGSFFKGKGIENIYQIAKKLKNIEFHVYGDLKFLDTKFKNKKLKNLKIHSYVKFNKIPKIISQHKVCLLPYKEKVYIKSNSITAEKFMSPIKLMEYLASKKIIVASKIKAYDHILKNKKNSFLVKSDKINKWVETINYVFNNYNQIKYIRSNAIKTAHKFELKNRVKKILNFYNRS